MVALEQLEKLVAGRKHEMNWWGGEGGREEGRGRGEEGGWRGVVGESLTSHAV